MQIPEFLKTGDKVMVISPSGKIEEEIVKKGMDVLSDWGLDPIPGMACLSRCGRFAGDDNVRFSDLKSALFSENIKAIFCSRGGYGAVRLLDKISDKMIFSLPKWLIGYSDITLLHAAFRKAGIISLHAPMMKHLAEEKDDVSSNMLRDILFGNFVSYTVGKHVLNRQGNACGTLFGAHII